MSTDTVQQELQETIHSYVHNKSTGKVIAVNGLWGTGKTYLWKSFFKERKTEEIVYPGIIENIRWLQFIVALLVVISLVIYLFSPYSEKVTEFYRAKFLLVNSSILLFIIAIFLLEWWKYGKYSSEVKTYSYVSLFGINSLEDFKLELFRNISRLEADTSEENKYLLKPFAFAKKNIFPYLKGLNLWLVRLDFTSLASNGFSAVNNSLICIDDLERRGNNLDIKDIMGLVSFLKEQKKCTIVLLYNYEEIGQNKSNKDVKNSYKQSGDKRTECEIKIDLLHKDVERLKNESKIKNNSIKDFDILLEKVIDIAFHYQPVIKDYLDIALKVKKNVDSNFKCDDECFEKISECVHLLNCKNIRIILLILEYFNRIQSEINDSKVLIELIIKPLVLIVFCRFMRVDDLPTLAELKSFSRNKEIKRLKKLMSNTQEFYTKPELLERVLSNYNLSTITPLHECLIDYVEAGYLTELVKNQLHKMFDDEDLASKIAESRKRLDLFDNSFYEFNKDHDKLLRILNEMLETESLYFYPSELDNLLTKIIKIGDLIPINEIINKYIAINKKTSYFLKSITTNTLKQIENNDLRVALEPFMQSVLLSGLDIKDILREYINARKAQLTKEDNKELANKSIEYYKNFIINCNYQELLELKGLLNVVGDISSDMQKRDHKIKEALLIIVNDSEGTNDFELNKVRLKDIFDIDYDEEIKKRKDNNINTNA